MIENESNKKNNISFRIATRKDAGALSELAKTTFYETFAAVNTKEDMQLYTSTTLSIEKIEKELGESNSLFFLVYDVDMLIGYARLRTGYTPESLHDKRAIEIERFYIRATHLGRHIGSLLMQECLDHAMRNQFHEVWLGVWERNHRALAFYKKFGFREFGSHPFLLGKDLQTDLLMRRSLK